MTDRERAPRWRRARNVPGTARRVLTVVGVALLCYSAWGALPANAFFRNAGTTTTTTSSAPQLSAMESAVNALVTTPAPAGFRQNLGGYLSQMQAIAAKTPQLTQNFNLTKDLSQAQSLIAAANNTDLAALNYVVGQLPSLKTMVTNLRTAAAAVNTVNRWSAARALRPKLFSDGCPNISLTPADLVIFKAILDVTNFVNQIFPDSFTIEIFGVAVTIPISPIKAIPTVLYIAAWAAWYGAWYAWNFYVNCLGDNAITGADKLTTYTQDHIGKVQVSIAVTPLDVSHYIIATHLNGQPVNVTTSGLQLQETLGPASSTGQQTLSLITSGVAITNTKANAASLCGAPTSSTITQVAWCQINGTDPGLYELFIPSTLAGSIYRLQLDDGTKCPTDPTGWTGLPGQGFTDAQCDHYGVATFTKATNA